MDKFGKYTIVKEIGRGGMGEVYKAHDPLIDRTVAIKIVTGQVEEMDELKQRLYREARSAGRLSHENITIVHDVAEHEGRPYIVMEFLEGVDLKTIIEHKADLDLAVKLEYAIQICRGLDFAHQNKVVHRDIKPENIKILPSGRIKIMDFGIAKPDRTSLTEQGVMVGTPSYVAPEQVKGEEVDPRSDIFSFGVLFQEILTYRKPFSGNMTTTIYKIVHEDPEPLDVENIPFGEELQRIVDKCLQKRREDRYSSCKEIIPDLSQILEQCDSDPDRTMMLTNSQMETGTPTSTPSGGTTIQNLLKRGKIFFDRGEYERAETVFKIILDRSPRHKIALEFMERIRRDVREIEASLRTSVPGDSEKEGGKKKAIWLGAAAAIIAILLFAVWRFRALPKREPIVAEPDQVEVASNAPIEKQGGDSELEPDVLAAEKAAAEARGEARASGAERFAPELFENGITSESEAKSLFQEGALQAALVGYRDAERIFHQARGNAETQSTANDVDRLRSLVDRERDRAREARVKAESAGAAVKAPSLFKEADKLEREAVAARDRGEKDDLVVARTTYGNALLKFKDAENRAREIDKARTRAIDARSSAAVARSAVPEPGKNASRPQFGRAVALEDKGKKLFAQDDYLSARTAFVQAKTIFDELRENIDIEREEEVGILKNRVTAARSAANPGHSAYPEAARVEALGDAAAEKGSSRKALLHYQTALTGFAKAERVPALPGPDQSEASEPVIKGERLQEGVSRLTDLFSVSMSDRDTGSLTELLHYNETERKGWDAFFESAEQIQARTEPQITRTSDNRATLTVKVFLDYYNKRNNSREKREFNMTWDLKSEAGTWRIISRK